MKLMIGIPAYNEKTTIKDVIAGLPKKIEGIQKIQVVVLDDGSTDNTGKIASQSQALVVRHSINRGLGGAIKTLFLFAQQHTYDILVTIDADMQHDGSDISRLIKPILDKKADVVIGSRWKKNTKSPVLRKMINYCANVLTYLLFSVWCSDTQSGLRAFNTDAISKISLQSEGMEVSSEVFKEIFRNKLKLAEIPIKPIYTKYSRQKGQQLSNGPSVLFQLVLKFLR
jgi:UDP-N-acetylglucosamine---dolichyl-phosphate N-acetylglucosaminyltransferase